jgi:hypothetical protein
MKNGLPYDWIDVLIVDQLALIIECSTHERYSPIDRIHRVGSDIEGWMQSRCDLDER